MPKQCPPPTTVYSTVSDSSYFVTTTINDGRVSFLIDTGSAFTILMKDTWERICPNGPPLEASTQTFVGVNGDNLDSHSSWELRINIGGAHFDHRIFVLSNIATEALLGLDFLEAHDCTLAVGAGELRFSGGKVPLDKAGGGCTPSPTRVLRVAVTTEVPAMSEMEVLATPEGPVSGGICLVEGRETVSSPVLVARAVVTAQAQQGIPVRILNSGKGGVTLYSGSRVAVASSVEASQVVECSDQDCRGVLSISRELEGDLWHTVEHVGEQLTMELREVLYSFLESYSNIFASSPDDFGRNAQVQHQINTGDAHPIQQRIRRIPPARRQEVTQLLQDMQGDHSAINESLGFPDVLVQKKDGSIRFCVDYCELNSVTRKDAYPLPRVDDTLDTLAGAKWFSTLDLLSVIGMLRWTRQTSPKLPFVSL